MILASWHPTEKQLEHQRLILRMSQECPEDLRALLAMQEAISRERFQKERCDRAATRLLAGDYKWVDEIRSSNEYEIWTLLGRSVAEAFKKLALKDGETA